MEEVTLWQGDCLELMKNIPDESVDMILCDLPYGTTRNKWDCPLPLDKLWGHYKRLIKPNGVIALFCDGMFTAKLLTSEPDIWRYNLVWDKQRGCDFLNANIKPLKSHEDIAIFYKKSRCTINSYGLVRRTKKLKIAVYLLIMALERKRVLYQKMGQGTRYQYSLLLGILVDYTPPKNLLHCSNTLLKPIRIKATQFLIIVWEAAQQVWLVLIQTETSSESN